MSPSDEKLLEGIATLVRAEGERAEKDAEAHGRVRYRVVEAIADGAGKPRPRWWAFGGLLAGAAAAAAVAAFFAYDPDLTYDVRGAEVSEAGFLRAGPQAAQVAFSDGSRIVLDQGTAARLSDVDEDGARLHLERGKATLDVVHDDATDWAVEAGPYTVNVTGTEFDVAWDPADETLRVQLHEGSVIVRGPTMPEGLALQAGQTLIGEPGSMFIKEQGAVSADLEPTIDPGTPPAPPEIPAPTAVASGDPAPPDGSSAAPALPPPLSWAEQVAKGDFAGVLADAERRGVDNVFLSAPLGDIVALGDAARYAGRSDIALGSLKALRKRFQGSVPAATAAFLLGRMAHDGGSPGGAIQWYDTYLSEAPNGTYASEALGRKMLAVRASQGATAATPIAKAYLAAYPNGAYAAMARELTGTK